MTYKMTRAEAVDRIKACEKQLIAVVRYTELPPRLSRKLTTHIDTLRVLGANINRYDQKVRRVHPEQKIHYFAAGQDPQP